MVVFDTTYLLPIFQADVEPPRHPDTNEPVEMFRERIDYLVQSLESDGIKIIVPTPALSEILVRAEAAGDDYLERINTSAAFRPVSFDQRAAAEAAMMAKTDIDSGDKRGGSEDTWAKVKFDRQIVAIAIVEGAKVIYSDDRGVKRIGERNGLKVIRIHELPLPKVEPQGQLEFDDQE